MTDSTAPTTQRQVTANAWRSHQRPSATSILNVRLNEAEKAAVTTLMNVLQRPFSRPVTMSEAARMAILQAAAMVSVDAEAAA
jgi:hypothetical protein